MAFLKIKEYISTDDAVAGTLLVPKLIMPIMVEEVKKNLIDRSLAAYFWGPTQLSNQGGVFNLNLETPNTGAVRLVGEGAEVPLDSQEYDTITFTLRKYGIAIRLTQEMLEDSQFELFQRNLRMAARRFAENETKLILLALDGAANTVTGGASVTIANITTAMQNVEDNDFTPTDIIIGNEVLNDLRNIDTFAEANKRGSPDAYNLTGWVGNVYGLDVHRFSTNAAPSTTYKKYAYVIDRNQAYGIAIKRDLTVSNVDLPTFDQKGVVVTQRIDVELVRSKAVSNITST